MDEERQTALQNGRATRYFGTLAELVVIADTLAIPHAELHVHGTVIPVPSREPRVSEATCIGCGTLVDRDGCAGVCKGLHPERLEAMLSELPGTIASTFLTVGRDKGILPRA